MPLNKPALKDALVDLSAHPEPSVAACAAQWAQAVGLYFSAIVPPSAAVAAAQSALQFALGGAFSSPDPATVAAQMEAAFLTCATTIGGGMAGFVPTPPAGLIGFAQLFAPPYPETYDAAAERLADAIHTWALTGTATLAVPPATVTPWS